jgi:hypothetical protein
LDWFSGFFIFRQLTVEMGKSIFAILDSTPPFGGFDDVDEL